MLTLQLRKLSDLYPKYDLGAAKNLHLMVQLLLLARTVNLWKLKDYVGMVLGNETVHPESHYRGLTRFLRTGVAEKTSSWTCNAKSFAPCAGFASRTCCWMAPPGSEGGKSIIIWS